MIDCCVSGVCGLHQAAAEGQGEEEWAGGALQEAGAGAQERNHETTGEGRKGYIKVKKKDSSDDFLFLTKKILDTGDTNSLDQCG